MSQPAPIANDHPPTWEAVIERAKARRDARESSGHDVSDYDAMIGLMRARDRVGRERYGVPLQPFNGRDSFRDAMEEVLDLAAYLENAATEDPTFVQLRGLADDAAYFCLRMVRLMADRR